MNLNALKHKEEIYALGQYLLGFVIVGLVLVGIGGTIYKVISPDGSVELAFGRSMSASPASLGSLITIAGMTRVSRGRNASHYLNRYSTMQVLRIAGAGSLYLG